MGPTFRPAGAADLDAVHALRREFYRGTGSAWDEAGARGALAVLLMGPAWGEVWLLETSAGPAGYVVVTFGYSLEFLGPDAVVDELYLAPAVRGPGLGGAALELAGQRARGRGVRALHLEVEPENEAALALYRRQGFLDHGRRLMTLWLDPAPPGWLGPTPGGA